jgi:hypothetical protein
MGGNKKTTAEKFVTIKKITLQHRNNSLFHKFANPLAGSHKSIKNGNNFFFIPEPCQNYISKD